jgi:hypothetical protein
LEVVNQAIITNLFGILLYFDIESYIIVVYDMNIVLEAKDEDEMIPFFSIASRDFDKDLIILKKVLHQFEQRTHSENAYKFSERATLAAGWWFYDVFFKRDFLQKIFQLLLLPSNFLHKNKKAATMKIVDTFQDQINKNGSDARIKMFGDIPLAAGWWSWLLK